MTTTLAELNQAAHAVGDPSIPMPAPAHTGGGSRLPMRDLIRMAAQAIHYLAVFDDHTQRPLYLGRQNAWPPPTSDRSATPATGDAPAPTACNPAIAARNTTVRSGHTVAAPTPTRCFSPAGAITAEPAEANGTPQSPTADDSAWTDGNGPPEINHAHHPEELLRGNPDPPDENEG